MALNLIPFPISIIFVLVFCVVFIVMLWKLRRRGRVYSILFKASVIVGILLFIAFIISLIQ